MNELQDAHVHLYLAAKRHATMKAMLEQMTSPDFQQALAEVEKAERRREVAKEKLARRRELLGAAPSFGSCKNLEDTESAVSVAEAELEKAEESILVMRGDCSESYPSSKPQDTTPRPAPDETAGPLPLTTSDFAFCFDGLRWDEKRWKKVLGNKPKWLEACLAIPGRRGVAEARWNPVSIGAALVRNGYTKQNSIRARFQTKPLLNSWLDAWKTYEAEYLDTD